MYQYTKEFALSTSTVPVALQTLITILNEVSVGMLTLTEFSNVLSVQNRHCWLCVWQWRLETFLSAHALFPPRYVHILPDNPRSDYWIPKDWGMLGKGWWPPVGGLPLSTTSSHPSYLSATHTKPILLNTTKSLLYSWLKEYNYSLDVYNLNPNFTRWSGNILGKKYERPCPLDI